MTIPMIKYNIIYDLAEKIVENGWIDRMAYEPRYDLISVRNESKDLFILKQPRALFRCCQQKHIVWLYEHYGKPYSFGSASCWGLKICDDNTMAYLYKKLKGVVDSHAEKEETT